VCALDLGLGLGLGLGCAACGPPRPTPPDAAWPAGSPSVTSSPAPSEPARAGVPPAAGPAAAEPSPSLSAGTPAAPPTTVGGACDYRKSAGSCTFTTLEPAPTFRFEGVVDGRTVRLEGNELADGQRQSGAKLEVGRSLPCTLDFLTRGTCTPCLLSLGSCGKDAWELFRASLR
jgi:hypothetical protein